LKKTHFYSDSSDDKYADYEEKLNRAYTDRKARRKRNPQVHHVAKRSEQEVIEEVSDSPEIEQGFKATYQPSRYEEGWLLSALELFYHEDLITDVLAIVKGGKEATVYRCAAHPRRNVEFLAAKVYRPRMFRSLSNDKMYREGRQILTNEGRAVKATDQRIMRALGKKTAYGEEVAHTSWMMYEYTTLEKLFKAGANVPEPIAVSENAILMTYLGDENIAAPALSEVRLDREEAPYLFVRVIKNIEIMLQHGLIHGDLSAYNILYWEGDITIIDFPQVSFSASNSNAEFILSRDIQRVCDYFKRQGVETDAAGIIEAFSKRYLQLDRQLFELDDLDALEE
jgi:RIO kinase 1